MKEIFRTIVKPGEDSVAGTSEEVTGLGSNKKYPKDRER